MSEPDVLDEVTECRDCDGTGAVYATFAGCPVDLDPPEGWTECPACEGNGYLKLANLEAKR